MLSNESALLADAAADADDLWLGEADRGYGRRVESARSAGDDLSDHLALG